MRSFPKPLLLSLATIVLSLVGAIGIQQALAGPTSSPPNENVAPPLNQSAESQVKAGQLGVGNDLTPHQMGGSRLYVKGPFYTQGSATVEGVLTTTQNAYANQFCLPGEKGGCLDQWPSANVNSLNDYCKLNDPRSECGSVSTGGWETLGSGGVKGTQTLGYDLSFPNTSGIELLGHGYEYRLIMGYVSSTGEKVDQDFFCAMNNPDPFYPSNSLRCSTPAEVLHQVNASGGGAVPSESYMTVAYNPNPDIKSFIVKASYTYVGSGTNSIVHNKARLLRRPRPSVF